MDGSAGQEALERLGVLVGEWGVEADFPGAEIPEGRAVFAWELGGRFLVQRTEVPLATADSDGRPWSSPVYFAHEGYREFFWVSSPEAAHSRNIAVRPEVGMVVFDSSAAIGTGQGVYMSGVAERADGDDRALSVFSRRSVWHGGRVWTVDDVRGDSGVRLYRAVADTHWMPAKDGKPDHRVPVGLG